MNEGPDKALLDLIEEMREQRRRPPLLGRLLIRLLKAVRR